ncbi:32435_t:CDS:2, partial [Racocetra persica]
DPKTNRKLGEKSNTSMSSIENNNREELSQSVKKEHKELSQPVKKEHKESANLMDTNGQCEPMLSLDTPVPVRVRADHQWCGRLYKNMPAEYDCRERLVSEISLNMMVLYKKDRQFLQEIRQTDRLVIEHVQLQKRLGKIIEHDAADYGKESGNEPFYAIYL